MSRILDLMRETGEPCVISGIAVRRSFVRDPTRVRVGVSPLLADEPGAYRATVAGRRVNVREVLRLLRDGEIQPRRRGWKVRVRCDRAATRP